MKGKQWLLKSANDQKRYGFTIPEVIAVIAITGVLAAITAPSLKIFGQRSPTDVSNQLSAVFRRTRAKAISQTSAYRIKRYTPNGSTTAKTIIQYSNSCLTADDSADWKNDNWFTPDELDISETMSFISAIKNGQTTGGDQWDICFDQRGLSDSSLSLSLKEKSGSKTYQIDVFQGGAIEIQAISS